MGLALTRHANRQAYQDRPSVDPLGQAILFPSFPRQTLHPTPNKNRHQQPRLDGQIREQERRQGDGRDRSEETVADCPGEGTPADHHEERDAFCFLRRSTERRRGENSEVKTNE